MPIEITTYEEDVDKYSAFDVIRATEMAARTSNAYKYDGYGQEQWILIILFMMSYKVDEAQIEWILRSKHMRWAGDVSSSGNEDLEAFVDYWVEHHDTMLNDSTRDFYKKHFKG